MRPTRGRRGGALHEGPNATEVSPTKLLMLAWAAALFAAYAARVLTLAQIRMV